MPSQLDTPDKSDTVLSRAVSGRTAVAPSAAEASQSRPRPVESLPQWQQTAAGADGARMFIVTRRWQRAKTAGSERPTGLEIKPDNVDDRCQSTHGPRGGRMGRGWAAGEQGGGAPQVWTVTAGITVTAVKVP